MDSLHLPTEAVLCVTVHGHRVNGPHWQALRVCAWCSIGMPDKVLGGRAWARRGWVFNREVIKKVTLVPLILICVITRPVFFTLL